VPCASTLWSHFTTNNKQKLHKVGYFRELLATNQDIDEGLKPLLRLCRETVVRLGKTENALVRSLQRDSLLVERVERLMTIPAVGPITAQISHGVVSNIALQVNDRELSKRERGRSRSPHREPIGLPPRARVDRTLLEREGNDPAASPCLKATDYARSPRTSRAAPRVAVCAERPSSPELAAEHTHGDSEVESMRCYREIALDRCPAQSV